MAQQRFELEVTLRGIQPKIWRRVELAGSASMEDVHFVLQAAMGWQNSHLHAFVVGKKRYGMMHDDEFAQALEDEQRYRLQDVAREGDRFVYEYDFGDGWEHDVKVVRVTEAKAVRPRCLDGARACPPEDCGGPPGYAELVEAIADPRHERHHELAQWADDFDPEEFDLPPGGLVLQGAMKHLKAAMAGDDDDLGDDRDLGDTAMSLPRRLVDTVLKLEPMQRASLAAMIAGSLADEVLQARNVTHQLISSVRAGGLSGRAHKPAKTRQRRK